ncbi:MAG: transcriptional repressor [bacterium]|nr:transcriptional repressor [bacterium]
MPKRARIDVEQARATIRAAGLRSTGPRLAVLQRLEAARTPLSHAELVADLASSGFDRATIYRNLIDLTQAGLVTRTDVGDHVWRFERKRTTASRDEAEHPHFMCTDCGTVACLPGVRVRIKAAGSGRRPSVLSRAVSIQLKGTCDRCA